MKIRIADGADERLALSIAMAALLNAFAYTLVVANPLVQSDVWRMLDGFLGRFVDGGFRWADVFVEPHASDTNLPLYKLFLFFNVRWFALDLRIEAVLALLAGAVSVWLMAWYPARRDTGPLARGWIWLLAIVAMSWLSLNASANYAWPLALSWHVPVLVSIAYFCVVRSSTWQVAAAATLLLGILLDEFAYAAVLAAFAAFALCPNRPWRHVIALAAAAAVGVAVSRIFYGVWEWTAPAPLGGADAAVQMTRSAAGIATAAAWKALAFPLTDSVVHVDNLAPLFGRWAGVLRWTIALALLMAHAWFWGTITRISREGNGDRAAYLASAVMLLGYAMVAGIVLQRVPEYGFDYLHQPRYVLFYQLNLAALAILVYRQTFLAEVIPMHRRSILPALAVAVLALQLCLSALAWNRAREATVYYERIAANIAKVAAAPQVEHACEATVRVCTFPAEQRQRIMHRLVQQRLNLFSPRFQALHRLYPRGPAYEGAPAR